MDLDDYNRNTDQGLHATSAAGVWASMIFGFGGMRTDGDVLSFRPTLPPRWKSYRFRVHYQGAVLEVRVNDKLAKYQVISGPNIVIGVNGKDYTLDANEMAIPHESAA